MANSSLSSVVSNLVRAQVGTAATSTITDEDLDRHVAELILKEAKQKAERYGKDGIRAFLPQQDSNAPRMNKRFLSSIIRNTDDHNKSILKAQALSAAEIRTEREEQERRDRRARAEEAAAAERMRRRMGGSRRDDDRERGSRKRRERSWERRDHNEDTRSRPRLSHRHHDHDHDRDHESERDERKQRRHRHSSRSRRSRKDRVEGDRPTRHRSRSSGEERHRSGHSRRHSYSRDRTDVSSDGEDRRRAKRRRSREDDRSHSHRSRSPRKGNRPSRSATLSDEEDVRHPTLKEHSPLHADKPPDVDRESELRRLLKGKGKANGSALPSRSCSPGPQPSSPKIVSQSHSSTHNRLEVPLVSPSSSHTPPSSRLRARARSRSRRSHSRPRPPSSSPPPVPPTEPPSKMDKYFEATYDPRLDVAPLAAPTIPATGLISDAEFEGWDAMLELIRIRREDKEERKRMERLGLVSKDKKGKDKKKDASGLETGMSGWTEGGANIMDIEYKKRGSVREWDLGKEGF